ncbi:MAG: ribosome small subunit-dependent GTPase A [Planctomycetaceae bacterium]|jgi:ribosome biogenesis GTPase / thiamine phosphate phosphatase|nr:ribosome small subunit-dependent GTPase A [Planctomycetaceae bacterium]MBT4012204.1 ribosome small subunit-dependent GTPase A [Planctomycetaceae bacterium]MBT4724498.1 ribosome small subunit-dependent GTPase A [Planctomycetaceae bacterium]MBT4846556.1 ribosome small subunit-dependent GTPase A [Planctomycetaceae bacterium]MBT5125805.1 ribosome small subunit-dependent GTPase A [Planctomycetaceae bacterium]
MAKNKKSKKIRTALKKRHQTRQRTGNLTREFQQHGFEDESPEKRERVSGKGDLTRHRTVIGVAADVDDTGLQVHLNVNDVNTITGRVLRVHGLESVVLADTGVEYRCAIRGLLKNMDTDQRNVVAAGDRVTIRPEQVSGSDDTQQGLIVRIEPRYGVISRTSRGQQHVIVTNVDQIVIVASLSEPALKPNLIDRFLITAERVGCDSVVCLNKTDLIDPAELQPLAGVYGQLGYHTLFSSATSGQGIEELRTLLKHKQSVIVGQSGVGKSSLLNAIDPHLKLATAHVSKDNQKGKHTTTGASLNAIRSGGFVVDTPGIRQFQLWDVIAEEVAGFYREIRPFINKCKYPDCSHVHERQCGVKHAVADGLIDLRRYDSYCQIREADDSIR